MAKFIPTATINISYTEYVPVPTSYVLSIARRMLAENPDLDLINITRVGNKKNIIARVSRGERPGEILESFDVESAIAPTKEQKAES